MKKSLLIVVVVVVIVSLFTSNAVFAADFCDLYNGICDTEIQKIDTNNNNTPNINWSPSGIKVAVDGQEINFPDQKPLLDADAERTYVPVRFLAENLGAEVDWDEEHQVVIIKNKYIEGSQTNRIHYLKIGSNKYVIAYYETNAPKYGNVADSLTVFELPETIVPVVVNNRTMLPFRYVAELMGAQVYYNEVTGTAHCVKRQMIPIREGGNIGDKNVFVRFGMPILSTLVGPAFLEELNAFKLEYGRNKNEKIPAVYDGTQSDMTAWACIDQITHPEQQQFFWGIIGQAHYMHYFSGDMGNKDSGDWHGSAWYQFTQTYLKGTKYADLDANYVNDVQYHSAWYSGFAENAYYGQSISSNTTQTYEIIKKMESELKNWGLEVVEKDYEGYKATPFIQIFDDAAYHRIAKQSISIWNTSESHTDTMLKAEVVGYAVVGDWSYMFSNTRTAKFYYQRLVDQGHIYRNN